MTSRSDEPKPDFSARGRPIPNLSDTELQKPLEQFRAKTKRLTIHPLERAALVVISAHLVFLPWALGGMRIWAQAISLAFSAVSLALALVPRNYTEDHTGSNRFRLVMWPKLAKFPIFWLGLVLLGLVTVQALNPAWRYTTDGRGWWMEAIPHHESLPSGVDAPLALWNQWRMLIIYSSAWMTACAIWVAFTRRRTVQLFLMTLAFNGFLLAGLGIAQRLLGNGKIFWMIESSNTAFFSSFIYKNHSAAYLNLILAVTCGVAGWYYLRGLRRLEKSNPSGVLAFFATCIAVSILTSYARGATLMMLGFLLVCIAGFVVHQIRIPSENRRPIVAVSLVLIFGYFLKSGLEALSSREAWDRLRQGIMREDLSLELRERATRASLEMLGDTWQSGVGAGSFRFLFTSYQHRHPELVATQNQKMFWEHAHNDIVQFPIELGALGTLLIIASFGYWIALLIRNYFWDNPLSICVLLALLSTGIYAWWDFPFQCTAVLITWCALWPVIGLWTQFEEAGSKS